MNNALNRFFQIGLAISIMVLFSGSFLEAQENKESREQIRIVGSSTVYPFSSFVAEQFGKTTRYPTPVVESTGSGGGHKLWGKGASLDTADLTNSSRKMKTSEFKRAKKNDVGKITEAVIGYDGIAVAQHVDNSPVDISLKQLTLAVAKKVPNPDGSGLIDNPYKNWSQIDNSLPDREIKIYGPPTTSGTRDAFEDLVLEAATVQINGYDGEYTQIRQDGPWVNAGENDNLIVKKIEQDRKAFGVFGFSFLDQNRDKLQGAEIGGVKPMPSTISSGDYPISRSLYFYIKVNHLRKVDGMWEYIKLFMSEEMIGPDGKLLDQGLIPLPEHLRKASRQRVLELEPFEMKEDGTLPTLQEYAEENGFTKNK